MSDIKMSEVFQLPVVKWDYSNLLRDQSDTVICNYPKGIELSAHAINTHDTLVSQVAELRGRLNDCVNDYIKNDKGDLTPSVFHRSAMALAEIGNE